jgi:hypothetical protein
VATWRLRQGDDLLSWLLTTVLRAAPFKRYPAFADPADAFQALGAIATVGVAIFFYDVRLVWPDQQDTEDDYERFVSVLRSKQILQIVAYLVAVSSWIVGLTGTLRLAGLLQAILGLSIVALAANFISSRREEARIASIMAQKRAQILSAAYTQSLSNVKRPSGSAVRFYAGSLPALVAAASVLFITTEYLNAQTIGSAVLGTAILTIFPIIGTFSILRMHAEIILDPLGRYLRRFLTALSILFLIAPNIAASAGLVLVRLTRGLEGLTVMRWITIMLVPIVGYIPLMVGGRQVYWRRREVKAAEQAAIAAALVPAKSR